MTCFRRITLAWAALFSLWELTGVSQAAVMKIVYEGTIPSLSDEGFDSNGYFDLGNGANVATNADFLLTILYDASLAERITTATEDYAGYNYVQGATPLISYMLTINELSRSSSQSAGMVYRSNDGTTSTVFNNLGGFYYNGGLKVDSVLIRVGSGSHVFPSAVIPLGLETPFSYLYDYIGTQANNHWEFTNYLYDPVTDTNQFAGKASGGFFVTSVNVSEVSEVPLPAALPLFAAGLSAMGLFGWRKKRKAPLAD